MVIGGSWCSQWSGGSSVGGIVVSGWSYWCGRSCVGVGGVIGGVVMEYGIDEVI